MWKKCTHFIISIESDILNIYISFSYLNMDSMNFERPRVINIVESLFYFLYNGQKLKLHLLFPLVFICKDELRFTNLRIFFQSWKKQDHNFYQLFLWQSVPNFMSYQYINSCEIHFLIKCWEVFPPASEMCDRI